MSPEQARGRPVDRRAVRRLLRRCLERDSRQRLRDIGEARIALASPLEGEAMEAGARPRSRCRSRPAPSPRTRFDDSTRYVDYPSWSPDGKRVFFSMTLKIGDLFLLENP